MHVVVGRVTSVALISQDGRRAAAKEGPLAFGQGSFLSWRVENYFGICLRPLYAGRGDPSGFNTAKEHFASSVPEKFRFQMNIGPT